MKELRLEELLVIDGGACSWKGAGQAVVRGAIAGAFIGSPIKGGIGGGAFYGATCWW